MMKGNKKSIGYLGPTGTFTELAVNALFPNRQSVSLQGYSSIQACLLAARQIKPIILLFQLKTQLADL